MKIAILLIFFIVILCTNTNAQNKITTDSLGRKILVGEFSWEDWNKEMEWQIPQDYCINISNCFHLAEIVNKNKIRFLIFAGSWCSDTKTELPKIIKIFQSCELPNYELIGVDRAKYEPSMRFVEYNIERVPTLVVLSNNQEIGRIIEFPKNDWFEDIKQIIEQK